MQHFTASLGRPCLPSFPPQISSPLLRPTSSNLQRLQAAQRPAPVPCQGRIRKPVVETSILVPLSSRSVPRGWPGCSKDRRASGLVMLLRGPQLCLWAASGEFVLAPLDLPQAFDCHQPRYPVGLTAGGVGGAPR